MKILNEIADSIHPMIKFTSDVPSNHYDGLLPVLDLKVKLTEENIIHYEFYEKVTKNPKVLLANSAFPWHSKRNIMVNEALRRLRNTAAELGPALQNQHLNLFMLKLKDSGYSEAFRVSVVQQAKEIYAKQLEQDRLGVKPLFRNRDQILKDKKARSDSGLKWWSKGGQNHYNTVLFVPPTPGGKLASAVRERVNQLCLNSKIKIKVLETGGTKVKNMISRKDPFPTTDCVSPYCPLCKDTLYSETGPKSDFRVGCSTPNVGYRVVCLNCQKLGLKAAYEGETGKPVKVRFKRHLEDLKHKNQSSPLHKHAVLKHPNENPKFTFSVTSKFKDPLTRQANEGVRIANFSGDLILNSKSEWNHPPTNRITVTKSRQIKRSSHLVTVNMNKTSS